MQLKNVARGADKVQRRLDYARGDKRGKTFIKCLKFTLHYYIIKLYRVTVSLFKTVDVKRNKLRLT